MKSIPRVIFLLLIASPAWGFLSGGSGPVGGGGGTPPVTMSGVVTGSSNANVFNSANTAGNTMNNAFTVNNTNSNNLGVDELFDVDPNSSIGSGTPENNVVLWDRTHYHVADLPACPSADTVIDDSVDTDCTPGGTPTAGTSFFACKVHCVTGSWKLNGHLQGPAAIATFPLDGTSSAITFGNFYSSPAATIECDGGFACFAYGLMGSTGLVGQFGAGPAVFPNGAVSTVVTVGTLPNCDAGAEGMDREVSDSDTQTWGATCAHTSGVLHAGCHCNGSAWTVYAK